MTKMFIYVEGKEVTRKRTHKRRSRQSARTAFRILLKSAGIRVESINILACGSGSDTYKRFKEAFDIAPSNEIHILLVDSEFEVQQDLYAEQAHPWDHLQKLHMRRPKGASDDNAQMMVQCYETLILADIDALKRYYGNAFRIPANFLNVSLENQTPAQLVRALNTATANTPKRGYDKGAHAYEILALASPQKIEAASPWAKRFFDFLRQIAPETN